jgi:hypothetical protein
MFPKWQPISTAPRDGTSILIYDADEGTTGSVRVARWRDDTIPTGWSGSERSPSHWLPLPLPPNKSNATSINAMAAVMENHSDVSLATGVSQ